MSYLFGSSFLSILNSFVINQYFLMYLFNSLLISFNTYFDLFSQWLPRGITINILIYNNLGPRKTSSYSEWTQAIVSTCSNSCGVGSCTMFMCKCSKSPRGYDFCSCPTLRVFPMLSIWQMKHALETSATIWLKFSQQRCHRIVCTFVYYDRS